MEGRTDHHACNLLVCAVFLVTKLRSIIITPRGEIGETLAHQNSIDRHQLTAPSSYVQWGPASRDYISTLSAFPAPSSELPSSPNSTPGMRWGDAASGWVYHDRAHCSPPPPPHVFPTTRKGGRKGGIDMGSSDLGWLMARASKHYPTVSRPFSYAFMFVLLSKQETPKSDFNKKYRG